MSLDLAERVSDSISQLVKSVPIESVIVECTTRLEQAECPTIHRFSPGVYVRELQAPSGTFLIGHNQRFEHMNVFLGGKVRVYREDGTFSDIEAPMIFNAGPGRKCGLILEDMVWMNVYPNPEDITDVRMLEDVFFDKGEPWAEICRRVEPDRLKDVEARITDVEDYRAVLKEFSLSDEDIQENIKRMDEDPTFSCHRLPYGSYKFVIDRSSIHGVGLMATASIDAGEMIAPVKFKGMRTPAGRFLNHSKTPNAEIMPEGEDSYLVATRDIAGSKAGFRGEEITTDYRDTIRAIGGV